MLVSTLCLYMLALSWLAHPPAAGQRMEALLDAQQFQHVRKVALDLLTGSHRWQRAPCSGRRYEVGGRAPINSCPEMSVFVRTQQSCPSTYRMRGCLRRQRKAELAMSRQVLRPVRVWTDATGKPVRFTWRDVTSTYSTYVDKIGTRGYTGCTSHEYLLS
jgi:ribosomal protein S14